MVGVASIVNPNAASSLGTAGGAVAVIAAFVFAFEVSRLSQDSQPEPHDGLMDGKELRG
jgi:hypothetical protein